MSLLVHKYLASYGDSKPDVILYVYVPLVAQLCTQCFKMEIIKEDICYYLRNVR